MVKHAIFVTLALLVLIVQRSSCGHNKKEILNKHQTSEDIRLDDELSSANNSSKSARRSADLGRFITFKSSPHDKLKINLEFSVPFLTLPIHRGGPFNTQEPVEINVRGILLAAGLGAAAAFVVPLLSDSIASHIEVPADAPAVPVPWPSSH